MKTFIKRRTARRFGQLAIGKSATTTALFGQTTLLFATNWNRLHAWGKQGIELGSDFFEPGFHKGILELRAAMVTA